VLLISSVLSLSVSSANDPLPVWNKEWSYRQEIKLPISTDTPFAKFQPIDIIVEFNDHCWVKDENEHSIRVCCWDGSKWHELESQIYDLKFTDVNHITRCGLVFLIPEIANGEERYFVYYDDNEKPSPKYTDHVSVEDEYYYSEPISGVSAEGDYYGIIEDGFCIYGVGQKGQVMNRKLSQTVIKEKPETKEFDYLNSEVIASFCFSYHRGTNDEDEISSDQILISKEIFVDGNLMAEFGIVSESSGGDLRTTNIYKYYYCPTNEKRICVHVKHEVLEAGKVEGILDADGRYGALLSLKSRSERIKKMRFGHIHPYLHIYGEDDNIKEYLMNLNPESKERQWMISYKDDCDLGKDAWISWDEGESGDAHAILFSSNEGVVKHGSGEKDGIQIKVAEREYLDIIGVEVDYVSINFGRNSFEKGGVHDVDIPSNLVVEFDAEFFTAEGGSYSDVIEEGKIFRTLIKHRHNDDGDVFGGEQNIHTLTVFPQFSGRIFSYPHLAHITGRGFPVIWVELYHDDTLVSSGAAYKPVLGTPKIKFSKLAPGDYVVKVYRKVGNHTKRYIGVESVKIEGDAIVQPYCTWQKNIKITYHDQYEKSVEEIEIVLLKGDTIVARNITGDAGETTLCVPFNLFDSYMLKASYKGFTVYKKELPMLKKTAEITLDLYDTTIDVLDKLGLRPGVEISPFLTSSEMDIKIEILPTSIESGVYRFEDVPAAPYELHISYGGFSDTKTIHVPETGETTSMIFSATFDLNIEVFDARGNALRDEHQRIRIERDGITVYASMEADSIVSLPPGDYTITVYSDDGPMGTKTIALTSDKDVKIVTLVEPILPLVVIGVVLVFLGELVVLFLYRKISLNTLLKLVAMSLILISLFQPWWALQASSDDPIASKHTEMFLVPQTMIERITYDDIVDLDLATIPEIFTGFLGTLLIIVCSGFILLGISFVPNLVLKRRFSSVLIAASIIFLILVAIAFSFGMSKLCELSLGGLQGEGILDVVLPTSETVCMSSSWGLGIGFYLCIAAALTAMIGGIMDSFKREYWPKTLLRKKTMNF